MELTYVLGSTNSCAIFSKKKYRTSVSKENIYFHCAFTANCGRYTSQGLEGRTRRAVVDRTGEARRREVRRVVAGGRTSDRNRPQPRLRSRVCVTTSVHQRQSAGAKTRRSYGTRYRAVRGQHRARGGERQAGRGRDHAAGARPVVVERNRAGGSATNKYRRRGETRRAREVTRASIRCVPETDDTKHCENSYNECSQ
jgi:hypothetical protein